jgi:RNA polymerase sigma-70 factor, ECF subfamily
VTDYGYADGLIARDARNARPTLNQGLALLRDSMNEMRVSMDDMLSLAVRGDGGSKRTRNRPHPNETPARHVPPGNNAKPVGGGRIATPARPAMPAQPGHAPGSAEGGPRPDASNTETAILPAVPATEAPAGTGGSPTGYPSRPDPSDPATEVWTLVERAQAGESEAFGLIYDRYVDTVFRFVYFRVGNRQLAEDLTSDTFLRALKRIGSFTWQGRDLGAWLVTIARNLVADHFKSGRYRLEVTTGDVLDADREDRGPEGSPEAAVVEHITNVALLTAVKQLNPEQQECIVLRFLQGFSVAETAKAMGKNEGAIKALQYRAVRALARLLPDGFQP